MGARIPALRNERALIRSIQRSGTDLARGDAQEVNVITLLQLKPYTGDVVAPSPNHGSRKSGAIEGIVLHATQDNGNEARSLSWMRSPRSRASCHLLVGRSGRVIRLVGDHERAWHAGASRWRGKRDVNSITLGIEIANRNDGEPFTDNQYARVAEIVAHYCRQGLSLDDVVPHSDIAPKRRTDPVGWNWELFHAMVRHQLRSESPPRPAPAARPELGGTMAALTNKRRAPDTMPKSAWRSRTLWLNGVTMLAAGVVMVAEALDLAFRLGINLPDEFTMWVLFGLGLVNIVLRFRTTCPLGTSPRAVYGPAEAATFRGDRVPI